MPDLVELRVDGVAWDGFLSYSLDASLYEAGDAFALEFSRDAGTGIRRGQRCEVYVNGRRELTGIVEKIRRKTAKRESSLTVEGRDLLGLVVDSHVEEMLDLTDISLQELAARMLKDIPFIDRKAITFGKGVEPAASEDEDRAPHADPGDSVFEVLRRFALSRGLLFYSLPDGRLIFGRPLARGKAEFRIVSRRAGANNNVTESEFIDDLTPRYSRIVVVGQTESGESEEDVNVEAVVTDSDVPFRKPFVAELPHDVSDAAAYGRMLREQQRAEGYQLSYTVPGHSQGGRNWAINSLVEVEDEFNGVAGTFLVYRRTFQRDKRGGSTTRLLLGIPGVLK